MSKKILYSVDYYPSGWFDIMAIHEDEKWSMDTRAWTGISEQIGRGFVTKDELINGAIIGWNNSWLTLIEAESISEVVDEFWKRMKNRHNLIVGGKRLE